MLMGVAAAERSAMKEGLPTTFATPRITPPTGAAYEPSLEMGEVIIGGTSLLWVSPPLRVPCPGSGE